MQEPSPSSRSSMQYAYSTTPSQQQRQSVNHGQANPDYSQDPIPVPVPRHQHQLQGYSDDHGSPTNQPDAVPSQSSSLASQGLGYGFDGPTTHPAGMENPFQRTPQEQTYTWATTTFPQTQTRMRSVTSPVSMDSFAAYQPTALDASAVNQMETPTSGSSHLRNTSDNSLSRPGLRRYVSGPNTVQSLGRHSSQAAEMRLQPFTMTPTRPTAMELFQSPGMSFASSSKHSGERTPETPSPRRLKRVKSTPYLALSPDSPLARSSETADLSPQEEEAPSPTPTFTNPTDIAPEIKRARAVSEHRRRMDLKSSFERLRQILQIPQPRMGKRDIVEYACKEFEKMNERQRELVEEVEGLRGENEVLRGSVGMWQQMRMNQGSGLAGAGLAGVGRGLGGAGQGGDESMTPPGVIRPPETGAETGMLGSYPPPQTITASLRAQQAQHAQHAQVADWVHQQLPRQNQMQQGSEIQVLASPTGHVPVTLYRRQQQQEAMVGTTAQWNSPPYVRPAAGTTALGMARGNSGENTEKEE